MNHMRPKCMRAERFRLPAYPARPVEEVLTELLDDIAAVWTEARSSEA